MSLRVTDAGPGIPAEIRDRMFDPFFTTKPSGSGLGLAVVHRAIEAHRGLVFVDSGPTRHALHRHASPRAAVRRTQPLRPHRTRYSRDRHPQADRPRRRRRDGDSRVAQHPAAQRRLRRRTSAHGGKAGLERDRRAAARHRAHRRAHAERRAASRSSPRRASRSRTCR